MTIVTGIQSNFLKDRIGAARLPLHSLYASQLGLSPLHACLRSAFSWWQGDPDPCRLIQGSLGSHESALVS